MKKKRLKNYKRSSNIKNIDKLKKDLFNFRFQKINGQIKILQKLERQKKQLQG